MHKGQQGGAGFIGFNLTKRLIDSGYMMLVLGHNTYVNNSTSLVGVDTNDTCSN